MPGAEDNAANRRKSHSQDSADRTVDEMLRRIGTDILSEPVPEKLRRVLRRQRESDGKDTEPDRKPDR